MGRDEVEPKVIVFFDNGKILNWSFVRPVSGMGQVPVEDLSFTSFGEIIGSSDSYVGDLGIVQGPSKGKELSEFF